MTWIKNKDKKKKPDLNEMAFDIAKKATEKKPSSKKNNKDKKTK